MGMCNVLNCKSSDEEREEETAGGAVRSTKIIIIYYYYHIIIIIEFLTSQRWLGNIHLSWDAAINRIILGGLICSLKSFLQLSMCQELQIFAFVYMYWGAS